LLICFAFTLVLGSALLFLVQPMFAKMVLPMLGGTPAVWNTCVVFFQAMLLAGYAYAHATTAWLGVKRQVVLHSVIVMLPAFFLPIAIRENWIPPTDRNPTAWLLSLLLVSVGLPFFVVSTTAPLLQKWFSTTRHRSASDPYFLYTASNAGSMFALLSYPLLVEPSLRLRDQSKLWAVGYGLLAASIIVCALLTWLRSGVFGEHGAAQPDSPSSASSPQGGELLTWGRRLNWLGLAAVPSSLMLGVTTFVSTDIAAIPLLWIVPLVLYLLTFIIAFSDQSTRLRSFTDRAFPLVVLPLVLLLITRTTEPALFLIPVHLVAFFVSALLCHLALASSRPSTAHLTEFYLWISVGGLVGGLFNTLLAPRVFYGIAEYPMAIALACLLRATQAEGRTHGKWAAERAIRVVAAGVLAAGILTLGPRLRFTERVILALLGFPLFLSFSVSRLPGYFAAAVSVLLAAGLLYDNTGIVLHSERTFFGVYRVLNDANGHFRSLYHGTTLHGRQSLDPAKESEPLTYYHRKSPIGQLFSALADRLAAGHIGVIGLGTGTLAVYSTPDQRWTFYEIDPAVVRISQNPAYFTYLKNARALLHIQQGDARLSLRLSSPRAYDLLIFDAFSSDAIPVHLMTREALMLYQTVLAADGVLAFHISNRHLKLEPILARLAAEEGLVALVQIDQITAEDVAMGKGSSQWVVMARTLADLRSLSIDSRWTRARAQQNTPLWTDDFSNILSVLGGG
jgi:spermidine synthase